MSDPVLWHRLQFAFTIVYHYLFPQLTMGLALLIVVLKWLRAATGRRAGTTPRGSGSASSASTSRSASSPACRWSSSSAPTGRRSRRYAGGVIGQTLAMEGLFAFFLESSFLGLLVFGERRLGPRAALPRRRWRCSSGAGCRATSSSAPTRSCSTRSATRSAPTGALQLGDFWAFLLNPWALAQYAHNMVAAVVTGVVRGGGGRRVLRAPGRASRAGAAIPPGRRHRRTRRRACWSRSRPATGRPSSSRAISR